MPILILPVPRCHQMITGHTMTAYSFAPERNQPHQCDLLFMITLIHPDPDARVPVAHKLEGHAVYDCKSLS